MDHLQIPIDTNDPTSRQRCNERLQRLKNIQFVTSDSHSQLGEELSGGQKPLISPELYQSVQSKNPDRFIDALRTLISPERNLSLSAIFDQVTGAGNSLLHLAADFGAEEIAELIVHHFPELLTKRNVKGDTPLHVAARAKSSRVIVIILSQNKALTRFAELTRLTNEYGNTALHEAVYANHCESVSQLLLADDTIGPIAHEVNKSGESLLYTAVCSDKKILHLLLQAASGKPSSMSFGASPLHRVIFEKDKDLLVEILEKKPELMYLRDEEGRTPLHYAASKNYLDGVHALLNKSILLAQERDAKGNFPIHLACENGHVNVVKEFIKKGGPNIQDLLNLDGQNVLHVAANNRNGSMVKYLLRDAGLEDVTINEKDKHGNTAMHLASKKCYPQILFHLTSDKRVEVNIKNNDYFTACDLLILNTIERPSYIQEFLSYVILDRVDAKPSVKGSRLRQTRKVSPKMDWIKDEISTIMLIAILIATVTFAAGFTVPGSVYSSDENDLQKRGMAVLANKALFQMFMICNTIAMYSSTVGCFILVWAVLGDYYAAERSLTYGFYMVTVALFTMSLAFMAAIRLVVSNVSWLANLITIIATIFFFLIFVIFILLTFPFGSRKPVLRQMSYFILRIFLWFHESHDLNKDKVKNENSDKDKDK